MNAYRRRVSNGRRAAASNSSNHSCGMVVPAVLCAIHLLRGGDAEEGEEVADNNPSCVEEREARVSQLRIDAFLQCGALFIELVQRLPDLTDECRQPMGSQQVRGHLHLVRI